MKQRHPKVSIVIPVYNGENFLAEAIDSALAQTYDNIEIIVVNDGSTDGGATDKVAKSYGNKIRYFLKKNGGVATALNYGIQKMEGSYFSWLSHDDMYEPTKVEEEVKVLEAYDTDVVVACNARVLFANGISKNEYIDKGTFDFADIFLATSAITGINGCALLIPRKALIDSGGFDPNLPVTQDYDLWFRLKDNYEFVLLEKNLVISRRHDKQDSVQKLKMCLEAGDDLHYDFLNAVPHKRFEEFFNKSNQNLEQYWNNYEAYKLGGFRKTASMMLKHLLRYYAEHDTQKHDELIRSEIGGVDPKLLGEKKAKKRVMFYSNVWHRGGIEKVLLGIFTRFGKEYDFILVTNNSASETRQGYQLPSSINRVEINNQDQIGELLNVISVLDVDVFVGNPNYSETFLDIYPLLNKTHVKTIAYNHGNYFLPYVYGTYLYPTALKAKESFGAADYVVWLSELGCNTYNVENRNGVYISNPVDADPHGQPKTTASKNVLAVGRFDDGIKQIDKTLLVFKELHKRDQEYHLDIVGYCPMEAELPERGNITLKDFIAEQNIPVNNITFWDEQTELSRFYKAAGFLLLTSKCEGFALVLGEALSAGVPCAALGYMGVEEIIQNGHNGLVGKQEGYADLADNIINVVADQKLYAAMSKNALESVKKFDPKIFYAKWKTLFKAVLGENSDTTSLKPENALSANDYKQLLKEYERLLNLTVRHYLEKEQPVVYPAPIPLSRSRVLDLARRLKTSVKQDGVYLTGEKIVRKVHAKLTKRQK